MPFSKNWVVPALLSACCAFLYLETFILPAIPRAATGDQAIYLHDAARMLDGELIYRDFDHFTFPGLHVWYVVLFRLFGVRAWIPQAMLVLIGVVMVWLSFEISRKLMSRASAILACLLFLTLPFSSYLDATHHWYSALTATAAMALLVRERTPSRLAWAGALLGLGACFAQSMVLTVLGLILFVAWEHRRRGEPWSLFIRKSTLLLGSFLAVVAGFNAYFIWKVGLDRFLYYTAVFPFEYYPADRYNTWRAYLQGRPTLRDWANWADLAAWPFIHLLLPLVYFLFLVRYWRESWLRPEVQWERLMLVAFMGLSLLLTVASAPAYNRLYTVSLPALILFVWLLDSPFKLSRILLPGLWAIVLALAVIKPVVTQVRWKGILNLPTGRTAIFNRIVYEHTKWISERTHPSDYFFGYQLIGFALRLRNPGPVAFVRPTDYTRPEEVESLVEGLEKHHVRFVSWYAGLDDTVDAPGDHLGPLRQYLRDHYAVAKTFEDGTKIWERSE